MEIMQPYRKIIIKSGSVLFTVSNLTCNELIKIKPRKWVWRQSSREHNTHNTQIEMIMSSPCRVFHSLPTLMFPAHGLQCATFSRFLLHLVQKRMRANAHCSCRQCFVERKEHAGMERCMGKRQTKIPKLT